MHLISHPLYWSKFCCANWSPIVHYHTYNLRAQGSVARDNIYHVGCTFVYSPIKSFAYDDFEDMKSILVTDPSLSSLSQLSSKIKYRNCERDLSITRTKTWVKLVLKLTIASKWYYNVSWSSLEYFNAIYAAMKLSLEDGVASATINSDKLDRD